MKAKLPETHPKIAAQWHPTKNGDLTPNDVTYGSKKKVWWKCNNGKWPDGTLADDHEWRTTVNSRTAMNSGCPCCFGSKVVPSNCLTATHPEIAKEFYSTKNGNLTPNNVKAGSNNKVWWKCYKGKWLDGTFADDHEWEATIYSRTGLESSCSCCDGKKAVPSNCLTVTHPEIAKEWHPTKNGNLAPNDVTYGSDKKAWWKCYKGKWPDGTFADDHEWKAETYSRTSGRRCPVCDGKKTVPSNCFFTTHPELAKEWDNDENGKQTPNDFTHGSHKKFGWKCCKGHKWSATIKDRTFGYGCPICNESKGEKAIRLYLESNLKSNEWKQEFKTKIDRPDFVVAKIKTTIEYNGRQHYKPVGFGSSKPHAAMENLKDNIRRDDIKLQRCHKYNIPMLIIPYWDKDRIPEILDDLFSGKTPTFSKPPKVVNQHKSMRKKIREYLGIKGKEVLCGYENKVFTSL